MHNYPSRQEIQPSFSHVLVSLVSLALEYSNWMLRRKDEAEYYYCLLWALVQSFERLMSSEKKNQSTVKNLESPSAIGVSFDISEQGSFVTVDMKSGKEHCHN